MQALAIAEAPRPSNESLRVLLVTPRYFPYSGGVENHVYQIAWRLASAGASVTVLTTDLAGDLPANEENRGVQIRRVRAYPARRDYYYAPEIPHVVAEGDWDVVHIQSYHTLIAPLTMYAALRARIPYLVTMHGGGHSSWLRNRLRATQIRLLGPLMRRAFCLVATARFEIPLFGRLLRLPPSHFQFIPNGGDLVGDVETTPPGTGALIASIGRLERYKGHQRVIASMPQVLARRPDARLWVAGTGPYEPQLRQLVRKLQLEAYVEIRAVPPGDRDSMARALARIDLMVLLSEYETHPMAVLEALSLGRPALVADSAGLSELADQGLATSVPLQSSSVEVAEAILQQLANPLVHKLTSLPSWDDCANQLLSLYFHIRQRSASRRVARIG